eukprot:7197239-Ditylum_brightwellii.AAC.1
MPPRVVPRKMDREEILEVLENRISMVWKFQMDKEAFGMSSSTVKDFIKTCIHYKECEPDMPEAKITACKCPSEREGKCKAKHKVEENYCNWG